MQEAPGVRLLIQADESAVRDHPILEGTRFKGAPVAPPDRLGPCMFSDRLYPCAQCLVSHSSIAPSSRELGTMFRDRSPARGMPAGRTRGDSCLPPLAEPKASPRDRAG